MKTPSPTATSPQVKGGLSKFAENQLKKYGWKEGTVKLLSKFFFRLPEVCIGF